MKHLMIRIALASILTIPLLVSDSRQPSQAETKTYVALGDSFTAGTGTYSSTDDRCYRSPYSYPVLVATRQGWRLDFAACSSRTIAEIRAEQVQTLSAATDYVTVGAGGNDAGFGPTMVQCALPAWLSDCAGQIRANRQTIASQLPGRLDALYSDITTRASQAHALVVGYPRLFNGKDCSLFTFFSTNEMRRLNALADAVAQTTAQRAEAAGLQFLDVRQAWSGHAICDAEPWLNNASWPVGESFHPNRAGHEAYAVWVSAALGASSARRAQQGIAAIPPPHIKKPTTADYAQAVPQLATPTNLRRAERAGISKATILRINRDLRSKNLRRQQAALTRLHQLDHTVATRRGQ